MKARRRLFVALDFNSTGEVLDMARMLAAEAGGCKIGLAAFSAGGPGLVRDIVDIGLPVFLDLKLHDIPNTVEAAAREIGGMGVSWTTVHALGGSDMMRAAKAGAAGGAQDAGFAAPGILAVTVLTSMSADDLQGIGIQAEPARQVELLAGLAAQSGVDGIVCSAWEAQALRSRIGPDMKIVTPGIRPEGTDAGDQKRVAAPAAAIRNGADFLVVGRPITRAQDPVEAARLIVAQIDEAVSGDTV